jgi:pimeloyl-ACP methyl ester carboxylesterase
VTRLFIHGLASSSRGWKAQFLSERFPDVLTPDFYGPLTERMKKLKEILNGVADVILIGSSLGGLMATLYGLENETRIRRLILLAPALNFDPSLPSAAKVLAVPAWLYIGGNDHVTPPSLVKPVAQSLFRNLTYHLADDDHLLYNTFPHLDWPRLLMFTSPQI